MQTEVEAVDPGGPCRPQGEAALWVNERLWTRVQQKVLWLGHGAWTPWEAEQAGLALMGLARGREGSQDGSWVSNLNN